VLFKANEAGTDQLLREGVIGRIMGFNLHESFSIKRTAKSTAAGYKVNGAKKRAISSLLSLLAPAVLLRALR
jgi:hypothetical protein